MSAPYLPLDFVEALARERRTDPHILASQGSTAPIRTTQRQRLGRTLVRFGQWLEGHCPDVVTGAPVALSDTPGRG